MCFNKAPQSSLKGPRIILSRLKMGATVLSKILHNNNMRNKDVKMEQSPLQGMVLIGYGSHKLSREPPDGARVHLARQGWALHELCYGKMFLKIFVVFMPKKKGLKEGFVGRASPILFWYDTDCRI